MIILTEPRSELFNLKNVLALRSNGTPLHLTVERKEPRKYILHAQGRGSFNFATSSTSTNPAESLRAAFGHYPDPVFLDSEPIERTMFPNTAAVRIAHAPDMDRRDTIVTPLGLDNLPPAHPDLNTYAGGILTTFVTTKGPAESYFVELPGEHPHWKPCGMVFINPVYVIQDEELDTLDPDAEPVSETSPLMETLAKRAAMQIERTMAHPDMPPRMEGHPFHHITGIPVDEDQAKRAGAPTSVRGIPVVFSSKYAPGPTVLSVAQALYRTDTGLVPVVTATPQPPTPTAPHRTITDFSFHVVPDTMQPPGSVWPVSTITLEFTLDGETEPHSVPAPFLMHGEDLDELQIQFVPSMVSPEDLERYINQAYLDSFLYFNRDEAEVFAQEVRKIMAQLTTQDQG